MSIFAEGGEAVTESHRSKYLIEGAELEQLLKDAPKDLKLIDCSFVPSDPEKGQADHVAKRITADTVFFDLQEIRDKQSSLLFMLPPLDVFKAHMVRLGIQKNH